MAIIILANLQYNIHSREKKCLDLKIEEFFSTPKLAKKVKITVGIKKEEKKQV